MSSSTNSLHQASDNVVDTIAELTSDLSDVGLHDGDLATVVRNAAGVPQIFALQKDLQVPPDGVLYVATNSGSGTWVDLPTFLRIEIVADVPFDFASPTVLDLRSFLDGAILNRAAILITTPFDGIGAVASLGTTAVPGIILGPAESVLSVAGQYERDELHVFAPGDTLRLTLALAGSTQGAGIVHYAVKG